MECLESRKMSKKQYVSIDFKETVEYKIIFKQVVSKLNFTISQVL